MRVEVDQSGKVEDTGTATVLAFSNDESCAILIPAKTKRACLLELRRRGKTGKSIYRQLFATGLFLLLKNYMDDISAVIVDVEYTGQEAFIKGHLLNLLRREGLRVEPDTIQFHRIGRRSPAHDKAYCTHRGDMVPDRTISLGELLGQFK